jgi:hypothetical protein
LHRWLGRHPRIDHCQCRHHDHSIVQQRTCSCDCASDKPGAGTVAGDGWANGDTAWARAGQTLRWSAGAGLGLSGYFGLFPIRKHSGILCVTGTVPQLIDGHQAAYVGVTGLTSQGGPAAAARLVGGPGHRDHNPGPRRESFGHTTGTLKPTWQCWRRGWRSASVRHAECLLSSGQSS